MDWLEITGFITGVVCVYLNAKENIWGWPIAMISVAAYAWVFYHAKLYADMGLQIFFFLQALYGFYLWAFGRNNGSTLTISKLVLSVQMVCILAVAGFTCIIYFVLTRYTDTDVPFWDALTTAISIVAQFLLARKIIDNWGYWLVANAVYIALYFYKELYLTAVLYLILSAIAIMGIAEWRKKLTAQKMV